VVDEAVARARSAKRHLAAYNADIARLNELLPVLRVEKGLGPKDIETLLEGVIERGTISRRTAAVVGTARKKPAGS